MQTNRFFNKSFLSTILSQFTKIIVCARRSMAVTKHTLCNLRGFYIVVASMFFVTSPLMVIAAPFPAEFELSSLLPENGGDGSIGFVLNGIDGGDFSGWSVSGAGDFDGDGFGDVLVGAWRAGSGGQSYVIFGSNEGFSAEFELSDLLPANGGSGDTGFILNGIDFSDFSSQSVSSAGDINADGFDDLILGAPRADPEGRVSAGESYIIFGTDQGIGPQFELLNLKKTNGGDGQFGFVLKGISQFDMSGESVSGAGDVNGDGFDDVIVGAPNTNPNVRHGPNIYVGESYVLFGTDHGFPPEFELSSLLAANGGNGSVGFAIIGISGIDERGQSGRSVGGAGDVNGDGFDDLVIGAPFFSTSGFASEEGESYVLFGTDQGFPPEFELSSLLAANGGDGSFGFAIKGANTFDKAGASLSTAGDINDDGIDDLIVGANRAGANRAGQCYVIFGTTQGFDAELEVSSLFAANGGDGSKGFVLNGIDANDRAGDAVSAAGDVNGDGIDDLFVAARYANPGGLLRAGESYIVFGTSVGFAAEFELSGLLAINGGDGSKGFVLNGINFNDGGGDAGTSIVVSQKMIDAIDVNNDGVNDLIMGARFADPGGRSRAGETYVIFGRGDNADTDNDGVINSLDNCQLRTNSDQLDTDNDGLGNRCDADLNQDCMVDFGDYFFVTDNFLTTFPHTDFNGDGITNFKDVFIFSNLFLKSPGPSGLNNICQ